MRTGKRYKRCLPAVVAVATGLLLQASVARDSGRKPQQSPLPVPLLERDEVRFVTLDVAVEEKARKGWRPARDLLPDQIAVSLGGRRMDLEVFENWCRPAAGAVQRTADSSSQDGTQGVPASDAEIANHSGEPGPPPEPRGATLPLRYILYFDLTHLKMESFHGSLKAARKWAQDTIQPADEVMIVTGGMGLQLVRPLAPAAGGILDDLDALPALFQATDMWGELESSRIREVSAEPGLGPIYAAMDFNRARRAVRNLEALMGLFDDVEGTKNLVFFQHTVRLYPGSEYPGVTETTEIYLYLDRLAQAANERNVKIYPVDARGLARGDVDGALTMLASETGGQWLTGTNDLGLVFDRVARDGSCFYRLGFRIRPRHTGRTRGIFVRVLAEGRYRVRHRQTLRDTTREQEDMERLRAAMLVPATAAAFSMNVTAVPMYQSAERMRVRIQVSVAVKELLALSVGAGARQAQVAMGGTVIPLEERATGTNSPVRWIWQDAAQDVESWSFARQAAVRFPAPSDAGDQGEVLLTQEVEVPVGAYRLVAVVQDRLARGIAAEVADFGMAPGGQALGTIRLMGVDPNTVMVAPELPPGAAAFRRRVRRGHITAAYPSLDERARVRSTLLAGQPGQLVFGICDPGAERPGRTKQDADSVEFEGWQLTRTLRCSGEQLALPVKDDPPPPPSPGESCVVVADALPGGLLPGDCQYEVSLHRPGGELEVRRLGFRIDAREIPVTPLQGASASPDL